MTKTTVYIVLERNENMKEPKYKENEKVSFIKDNEVKVGVIYIVDSHEYFGSATGNPSYDVFVESEPCLYKHIDEDELTKVE